MKLKRRPTSNDASRGTEFQSDTGRGKGLVALLLVAVITAAVYARTAGFDFSGLDDNIHVYENPYLAGMNPAKLAYFWRHSYENLYIPLSYMVFAALASRAAMPHMDPSVTMKLTLINPHVFHTANIVLHVANVLLVFAILRRVTRKDLPSVFGALLFALHPLQVESVAWISEMRGLLAGLFGLGATLAYVAAATTPSKRSADSGRSGSLPFREGFGAGSGLYWLAGLLLLLGLLCKPSIAPLPLGLLALDIWVLRRPLREAAWTALPLLLIVAPFVAITHNAQPVSAAVDAAPLLRPLIAADALAFYLGKFFWPVGLTLDYDRTPANVLRLPWTHFIWLVPVAAGVLVAAAGRRRPWLCGAAWFSLILVLPVLGFVPFSYQRFSTVADRYVYMAMLGPALALALALAEVRAVRADPKASVPAPALAGLGLSTVLLVVLSVGTYVQTAHWRNSLTLLGYAVRMAPNSAEMHNNYAVTLVEAKRPADAVRELTRAIQLDPTNGDPYTNLSDAYQLLGQRALAANAARTAITLEPRNPRAYRALGRILLDENDPRGAAQAFADSIEVAPNLAPERAEYANALLALGEVPEAIAEFKRALSMDPTLEEAEYDLGNALARESDMTGAEAAFRRAIALNPIDPLPHGNLGNVLSGTGRPDDALAEYRTAVGLAPSDPDMHFNLGYFLLHHNDPTGAISELQSAVRLSPVPENYDELGVAYAVAGDAQDARTELTAALRLDPTSAMIKNHLSMLNGR
ncbi:MAG: tetratricopeptide repeat protein [Capsulimonadaceae bacterium]